MEQFVKPITLCGLAGVGKSTAIRLLEKELGFRLHSSGDFVRQYAQEQFPELSKEEALAKLEERAKTDPSIDLMIDGKNIQLAKSGEERWILDSRLGWYFCPHSFKVLLTCDNLERVKRIARRDTMDFSDALYATMHRESAIKERYQKLYGISDFTSHHLFDVVANTTVAKPDDVASLILITYKEWCREHS